MADGVLIDEQLALRLVALDAHFQRTGHYAAQKAKSQPISNQRYAYVRNDAAEAAPPYACMQVTGTVEVGGQNYLIVEKPADADGTAGWFIFNGPSEIEQDGYGIAFDGPLCRMLTDGTTITAGEVWGPVAASWEIAPDGSLFVAAGADDIATDVMKGFFRGGGGGGETVIGVTRTGGLSARSSTSVPHTFPSTTIDLLDPDTGDWYDPAQTQIIYNSTSVAVAAFHIVQAKKIGSRYFIDVDDCSGVVDGPEEEEAPPP